MLRTGNKTLAAATLLLDALKGLVAVTRLRDLSDRPCAGGAAVGAVLGHMFPVWLQLQGRQGRGDDDRRDAGA